MFTMVCPTSHANQKECLMPGTSTVPTIISGTTSELLSMSWIDNEDKEFTDSFLSKTGVLDSEIQSLIDTAQPASNASLWRVAHTRVWEGQSNASSAASNAHESVRDLLRLSFKDLSNNAYQQAYVPAPLTALITAGGDVDTANALYTAWKAAVIAAIRAGFDPLNVGFVERVQRNSSISP